MKAFYLPNKQDKKIDVAADKKTIWQYSNASNR